MQDANNFTVRDVAAALESWAPPSLQESYDNSGLLVGTMSDPVASVLVSLDCTEAVVQEAIELGATMIVSHHPIVFKGLKRFNGSTYVTHRDGSYCPWHRFVRDSYQFRQCSGWGQQ